MCSLRVGASLVVTDLDGTFWERPDRIHPKTLAAVGRLAELDIPWIVATGRRVASTRQPLVAVGLAPPAVVLNGGLGLDLSSGERFHRGGFDAASARTVLNAFQHTGLEPCVYVDHDDRPVWIGESPSTHPDHIASFGADVTVGDLGSVVVDHHVLAFAVLGISEDVASAIAAGISIQDSGTCHVAPDRLYGGITVTVAPTTISKWDGVVAYCRWRGIDPDAVVAIGDGPNDAELLRAAAFAVAPVDAHPSAVELADHVVGRAADGGWAELLDLLGPSESA